MGGSFSKDTEEVDSRPQFPPDVNDFIDGVISRYRPFSRNEVRRLRKGELNKIWRDFIKREQPIFEQIQEQSTERDLFKFRSGTKPCRLNPP